MMEKGIPKGENLLLHYDLLKFFFEKGRKLITLISALGFLSSGTWARGEIRLNDYLCDR